MSQMQPPDAFLLRTHVGEATGPDGRQYEMALVNGHMPAIKDLSTRKTYVFGWDDLLAQAVAAGVSEGG